MQILGDYNGDCTVDAANYVVWRDTLGSTTNLAADGSGNGFIGASDYTFWRARFGNTAGSGSGAAVPEPKSLLLVLVGVMLLTLLTSAAGLRFSKQRLTGLE